MARARRAGAALVRARCSCHGGARAGFGRIDPGGGQAGGTVSKGKLLLVEDDKAIAELLLWHFQRQDFDVRCTPDGEEALLLAAEEVPDLVILDWMIGGISGLEVCRRLRRGAETANVPIIMLTARGEEADRIRGLETGADDY